MLKKKGGGQIMSEIINHIKTEKKCKKQGKAPKYVGENLILKSRPEKIKKRGKVQNMSEKIDLVIIGKKNEKKKGEKESVLSFMTRNMWFLFLCSKCVG